LDRNYWECLGSPQHRPCEVFGQWVGIGDSTSLAVAGTIGVTTKVKGTLVCNGLSTVTSALVDTPPVPFDPQGTASFVGDVTISNDCLLTPDKLAFLI